MNKNTDSEIKELLLELVGETIQPALEGIPFRTPNDVKKALQFLAEEIESIDPNEVYKNLTVDAEICRDEDEAPMFEVEY